MTALPIHTKYRAALTKAGSSRQIKMVGARAVEEEERCEAKGGVVCLLYDLCEMERGMSCVRSM